MQHFLPHMLKSSASAIKMLHKSKTCCIKKSSGDRNTARVFSPLDGWRWETAGVLVLTQPPKQSPVQINRPWKHPKRAGSIPAVGWTRPHCKPTLALLSSRARPQFVAHYFIHPESEQHIPDSLLAPDNIPHILYGHRTNVYKAVYVLFTEKKVSSAFLLFFFCFNTSTLTRWFISPNTEPKFVHTHPCTSILVKTQQTHQPFCKHNSSEIISGSAESA